VLLEIEHFVDYETDVTERSAIGVHDLSFLFRAFGLILRDGRPRDRK